MCETKASLPRLTIFCQSRSLTSLATPQTSLPPLFQYIFQRIRTNVSRNRFGFEGFAWGYIYVKAKRSIFSIFSRVSSATEYVTGTYVITPFPSLCVRLWETPDRVIILVSLCYLALLYTVGPLISDLIITDYMNHEFFPSKISTHQEIVRNVFLATTQRLDFSCLSQHVMCYSVNAADGELGL